MFDKIAEARERDGSAADGRADEVNEIMAPREKPGYGTELPLLGVDYDEYPDDSDLLRPSEGDTLRTLVDHDKVHSVAHIADELDTTEDQVRQAAELHGVSLPEGNFNIEVATTRLDRLVGDIPDGMVSPENQILTAYLFVEKGLSTKEIADVLGEEVSSNVREEQIRQTLIDCHVLDGETTEEREQRWKQNRGEINRPQYDSGERGITIDASDL